MTILGQGSFGVVAKALDNRRSPPVEVAIKLLPRGDFTRIFKNYIKREILHQSTLRHPFIIAIKQARPLLLCMHWLAAGSQADVAAPALPEKPRLRPQTAQKLYRLSSAVLCACRCSCCRGTWRS